MWLSLKSLSSLAKIIQNTLRSSAFGFHKMSKCRTEMALIFLRQNWFGSCFWNDSPFVLLWATSASKIRCKVPLYVTVKGHWERSATFTARLHCNSGITSLHTIYRRIAQTDSPNTHWVYCYLMDRGVCLVFCVFFFFTKENYNCVTAHPETGSASESWSSMGRQV